MFQLTRQEKEEVVTNCDHLKRLKFSPNLPYAFTEHGAIMLATVLNSPVAVQSSTHIVRQQFSVKYQANAPTAGLENPAYRDRRDILVPHLRGR
jgi:hypothetical protein